MKKVSDIANFPQLENSYHLFCEEQLDCAQNRHLELKWLLVPWTKEFIMRWKTRPVSKPAAGDNQTAVTAHS